MITCPCVIIGKRVFKVKDRESSSLRAGSPRDLGWGLKDFVTRNLTCSLLAKRLIEALLLSPVTTVINSLNDVLSWVIKLSMIVRQLPMHVISIWKKFRSSNNSITSFFHARRVYWYPLKEARRLQQARKLGTLWGLKKTQGFTFSALKSCRLWLLQELKCNKKTGKRHRSWREFNNLKINSN